MATILNAFAHQQGVISQSKHDDTAILPSQFSIPKQGQTGFAAAEWELENGVVVGAGDFKRR